MINGEYRENVFDQGVFLYCDKYSRTKETFKNGLYHYSFSLNTDFNEYQPSGSSNFSRIDKSILEHTNNIDGTLKIFAINYNILRVVNGMASLAFSN